MVAFVCYSYVYMNLTPVQPDKKNYGIEVIYPASMLDSGGLEVWHDMVPASTLPLNGKDAAYVT